MKEVCEDEANPEQKPLALQVFGARRMGASSRRAACKLRRRRSELHDGRDAPFVLFKKTRGLIYSAVCLVKPERRYFQRLVSLL